MAEPSTVFSPAVPRTGKEGSLHGSFRRDHQKAVPNTAVITAGRIQSPETAEEILRKGMADLIGLGRVLFADPLWPKKAAGIIPGPIRRCEPYCSVCTQRALYGRPAFCSQWDFDTRDAFLARVDEMETFLTKIEDRHDP